MEYIDKLEKITDKKFGDLENPLLVSVRSGARAYTYLLAIGKHHSFLAYTVREGD